MAFVAQALAVLLILPAGLRSGAPCPAKKFFAEGANTMETEMNSEKYFPPKYAEAAFHCPHCGVYAAQYWQRYNRSIGGPDGGSVDISNIFSICTHCNKLSIWIDRKLIFPVKLMGPYPNMDMPDDVLLDYEEARKIINLSPRGATALLRLCVQKLCIHLGEPGKNINDDIASLVKKGMSQKIQQALDLVRVIGNDAVHPGSMDMRDDSDTAERLCLLINVIIETTISQEKMIKTMYDSLPKNKLDQINKRDKNNVG